jgi:3-oxoadipate enol-lactonase
VEHVELASGRIRARIEGAGQPLVLLHSLLADAGSWGPLAARLRAEAKLIIVDLPGFGGLPPVRGGLEPVAGVIFEAIAALELVEPVIIGNGFGSFLALRLALDYPQRVGRLVLIGCGARFSDPGRAAFRAMRQAAAAKGLEAVADIAMARLFAAEFRAANPDLLASRRAAFLRTDPATFADACEALEALDLSSEAGRVAKPALLLAGSEDKATPPAMAGDLARLMRLARFKELAGLAHVPQLQDPERLRMIIADFIGNPRIRDDKV